MEEDKRKTDGRYEGEGSDDDDDDEQGVKRVRGKDKKERNMKKTSFKLKEST